jgi:hypothetical protein
MTGESPLGATAGYESQELDLEEPQFAAEFLPHDSCPIDRYPMTGHHD